MVVNRMKEHKSTFAGLSFIPVRIVVAYAIFSFLWISSSIALLKFFIQARQIVTTLCIVNGLAYIIIS